MIGLGPLGLGWLGVLHASPAGMQYKVMYRPCDRMPAGLRMCGGASPALAPMHLSHCADQHSAAGHYAAHDSITFGINNASTLILGHQLCCLLSWYLRLRVLCRWC